MELKGETNKVPVNAPAPASGSNVVKTGSNLSKPSREGLIFYRFMMVIGSMAPLFVLVWLRGTPTLNHNPVVPSLVFNIACMLLIFVPSVLLVCRQRTVRNQNQVHELVVGNDSESKDHLLVYLFAMVIPLYQTTYSSKGEIAALLFLVFFIGFVFWHLNLHYMNVFFAIRGYRVFTVQPPSEDGQYSGRRPFILLSKRHFLAKGMKIQADRLSETVFIERG